MSNVSCSWCQQSCPRSRGEAQGSHICPHPRFREVPGAFFYTSKQTACSSVKKKIKITYALVLRLQLIKNTVITHPILSRLSIS